MAVGKESGEFSYKVTSVTYNELNVQLNLHGTATGFGTVQGTLTVTGEPGATSGKVSFRASAFLDDGKITNGTGEGTWETVGKHVWRIRGINYIEGRTFASEGDLELATLSLRGKIYEWN
jgi:hypothetical protein